MLNQWVKIVSLAGVLVILSACQSTSQPGGDKDTGATASDQRGGAETGGTFQGQVLNGIDIQKQRVLYFEFDSSELSAEARDLVNAHATHLAGHPNSSIVLEGHADERGTREYNLALGERRAKTVEQLMLLQGVAKKQIQVISFGEERPVAPGHDESAWRLNRRVEILYSGE